MAASDKPFNNQRTLDIVYAVSNILMLLSVIWMFVQDYSREYKTEQRVYREVEVALAQRLAMESLPSEDDFKKAEEALDKTRPTDAQKDEVKAARAELARLQPGKEKAEARFQAATAELSSKMSLRDIALEHAKTTEETAKVTADYDKILKDLNEQFAKAQAEKDDIASKMKAEQMKIERIEAPYTRAVGEFKKVNDKIDAQVKLALAKRWGFGDWLRTQWIIDGFASPLKIHQFTISDIPIDYNFRQVTRFDRCMSCHVGIADARFSRQNLEGLTKDDPNMAKLEQAKAFYDSRVKALGAGSPEAAQIPNPHHIQPLKLSERQLTPGRITEFAAHPRLDLFVGSNSKHPGERFGCTSCHSGQGSGTSFVDASHSPNSMAANAAWTKERGWEFNHMWDFPMHSKRFVESSCLKCHHEVTDLISSDNRVEAPKLLRGHSLIKENGCFGCHEISGWKSGQRVGPDLRLEPNPPLDDLRNFERNRAVKDIDNRPGNLRKVGPSLARVHEKLDAEWIARWVRSPSAFRPDTKMPHYYGLSTNDESVVKATAPEWEKSPEKFPNTEIASIAHFLTATSKDYLTEAVKVRGGKSAKQEQDRLDELVNRGRLDEKEQKEFDTLKRNARLRKEMPLEDLTPKGHKVSKENGRILFTERGCLACHTHQGTETVQGNAAKPETFAPDIKSDAVFGPNLSQVAQKLGNSDAARKWLIQWIINPQVHSPRSRMPVTHLTPGEAADIADWLLAQPYARDENDPWNKIKIDPPSKEDLKNLARVYLTRMMSKRDMDSFLKGELKGVDWEVVEKDVTKDELRLKDKIDDENELKYYLGKKAVTRLGCFGCHDIPGMESVKSIGVGLNDWGKKPADRLAFEDIDNFYAKHYHTVPDLVDKNGKPEGLKDGKEPYESFYTEALTGHHRQREGYLNQKIRDPRSYDFNRIRAWDDRARMPRFTLARPRKHGDEKEDEFKARAMKDEAVAREAVATFVLGLTAEQVPTKSINQPTGDRLAEIKGRQVLDKYNCAGCHTIRPGVYDFKLGPKSLEFIEATHGKVAPAMKANGELKFANHHNYVGRNPLGVDRLTIYGSPPVLQPPAPDEAPNVLLRIDEAVRFVGKDKVIKNLPASTQVFMAIEDFLARPDSMKSQADVDALVATSAPYGGAFANLMAGWLSRKDAEKYPAAGNFSKARVKLPPSLTGQGERTQADWLYEFLLDPQPVRRITILRMPKFNLGTVVDNARATEEAKILVDYFAAVGRQTNPGIGLSAPHELIPPRSELSSDYWRAKTKAYVEYLKNTDAKDKDGKSLGIKLYKSRVDSAYNPLWKQIRADKDKALNESLQELSDLVTNTAKKRDTTLTALKDEKDAGKQAELKKQLDALELELTAAASNKSATEKALANLELPKQQELWDTEEAYAADAYRLLTSRDLCAKCHQVGSIKAVELINQGPPLDLAIQRLRPEWIEQWVNQPQRFLAYDSIMPAYFDSNKMQFQNLHAGGSAAQIQALRDVLMNLPRVSAVPVNRLHNPDRPAGK